MSDNLVRDYLEEIKVISPEQYLDILMLDGDEWEIYRSSDESMTYVRFELTGKLGYAFCANVVVKKLSINFSSFYYVKSYGNEIKNDWECEQLLRDRLTSNAVSTIQPY